MDNFPAYEFMTEFEIAEFQKLPPQLFPQLPPQPFEPQAAPAENKSTQLHLAVVS